MRRRTFFSRLQLGHSIDGGTKNQTPQPVTALGNGVLKVAAGFSYTCAVKSDGTLWCWGDNMSGAIGLDAGVAQAEAPVRIAAAGSDVVDVSASENTCIRKADDSVWCWGANDAYQCGNGGPAGPTPTRVDGVSGATAIVSGVWNSCALTVGAVMECWGSNGYGELGVGTSTASTPTPAAPLLTCP